MLKGIDPLLTPELLAVLAGMGHGDELVVADANFPAARIARGTVHGRAVHVAGASVPDVVRAVLTLLPLDDFVGHPARRMAVDDAPEHLPPVQEEMQRLLEEAGIASGLGALGRFPFYQAAEQAFAVVITGEVRPWANLLLRKGVLASAPARASAL